MFANAKILRLNPQATPLMRRKLPEAMRAKAFMPRQPSEMSSHGWVKPVEHAKFDFAHMVGLAYLLTLRVETAVLPSASVTQQTIAACREVEAQQGYKPGRKQTKEIKERVREELLPRALTRYRDTRVLLDAENGWLVIDTPSSAVADEVLSLLGRTMHDLDTFPVESLYVTQAPAAAMTGWLAADEAPANFTIDQDAELRASGESRAAIRYVRHTIDADDVRRHIQAGKQCTRLAMTWADKISFVLTEGLDVRRIRPLDVIKENADALTETDEGKFDADFYLFASEFNALLADLVQALGGEKKLT